jgi:hypothetical protein
MSDAGIGEHALDLPRRRLVADHRNHAIGGHGCHDSQSDRVEAARGRSIDELKRMRVEND